MLERAGGWRFVLTRGLPYAGLWAAIGFVVWFSDFQPPHWLTTPQPNIASAGWRRLIGLYFFSVAGSTLIINPILMAIRKLFGLASSDDVRFVYLWPPILLGTCEAILYPTAFLMGHAEFVGVWLAVKVAGQWNLWLDDRHGRNRFNMFLIGNAMSIALGVLVWYVMRAVLMTS
jgi:hypothetical protein